MTVVLASGWELTSLAAAVIGGVSVTGGSGTVVGAALGAVVLATIDNGLVLLRVPEFWRMFIQGTAIVGAATADVVIGAQIRKSLAGATAAEDGMIHAIRRLPQWELTLVVLTLVAAAWSAYLSPYYLSLDQIALSTRQFVFPGILALGLAVVVILGEIDISLASTLAFGAVLFSKFSELGLPIWIAVPIVIAACTVLGVLNGCLVARLGLPSLAVTLGTMGAYRGLAFIIGSETGYTAFDSAYTFIGSTKLWGTLPVSFLVFLARRDRRRLPDAPHGLRPALLCGRQQQGRRLDRRRRRGAPEDRRPMRSPAASPASRRWSGSGSTARRAATTPTARSSSWSPPSFSAASTSMAAAARSSASSSPCSCSARSATAWASPTSPARPRPSSSAPSSSSACSAR